MAKKNLTLEQLISLGVPLEEILANRDQPPVNVTVDTDDLSQAISKVARENTETLLQIKSILAATSKTNTNLMMKTAQMLAKQNKEFNEGKAPPVKGLKVVRDEFTNLIDSVMFIT